MRISPVKKYIFCLIFVVAISGSAYSQSLEPQQGRYWKWSAPHDWRHSESIAGVTLTSPDGQYTAALSRSKRTFYLRATQNLAFLLNHHHIARKFRDIIKERLYFLVF